VGLIQRQVEEAGIPTISIGNMADRMDHIKPPRALLVKFPRGSMLGEPGNVQRQRRIILDALKALSDMTRPGTVQELPYRWKKPYPNE
jgi:D-proline reductase (dithiol) PrdB